MWGAADQEDIRSANAWTKIGSYVDGPTSPRPGRAESATASLPESPTLLSGVAQLVDASRLDSRYRTPR
jgi:hypothetical protein